MTSKILFIDDALENGLAATAVDSRIDFISRASDIKRPLQEYDVIITDMRMEHAQSGFDVVKKALGAGRLPYIATGGTYEHGGIFDRVTVLSADLFMEFNEVSKSNPRFWRDALAYIERKEAINAIGKALAKVYSTIGVVPDCTINMLMSMYQNNYKKIRGELN
jgi:hypothetical protein